MFLPKAELDAIGEIHAAKDTEQTYHVASDIQ